MTPTTDPAPPGADAVPEIMGIGGAKKLLVAALAIWLVGLVPAYLFDPHFALGFLAGGAVLLASLSVTVFVAAPLLKGRKLSFFRGFLFWFKYTALLGLVGYFIAVAKISSAGFLIGFSVIIPAVLVLTFFRK